MSALVPILAAFIAALGPAPASHPRADVYGKPRVGRVLLFHGLAGSRTFVTSPPFDVLLRGLERDGYQVVVPDLPYDGPDAIPNLQTALADGGGTYRATWDQRVRDLITWTDRRYGRAPIVVGGISWGGWHSLAAACADPRIVGYFAHAPVVDPTVLNEFSALPLPGMTLRPCATKPGYVSYGTADTRVGVRPVRGLVARLRAAHARLRARVFPGMGHDSPPMALRGIVRWLSRGAPG